MRGLRSSAAPQIRTPVLEVLSGQLLWSLSGLSPTGEGFPGLPQPVLTMWDRGAAFRSQGEGSKGEQSLVWERLDSNPLALNSSQSSVLKHTCKMGRKPHTLHGFM